MTTPNPTPEQLSEKELDDLWAKRFELLNWAHISYRYHRKRQRFFDVLDKLSQVAAVGGGVAVAGKTLSENLPLVGGAIAFAGLLALVFGYGDKRQCHKELAELAMQLVGEIESLPFKRLTEEQLCAWEKTRATINMREPANLRTLVWLCEWEQAVSEGHTSHVSPPQWFRKMHMHLF